jgi:2-deoxy-D-gluconate 3-dehydrogenase
MDYFSIQDKKAIVTGGSRGLGKAIAEAFVAHGAEVVIIGKSVMTDEVAPALGCFGVRCDLADRNSRAEGFDEALQLLGGSLDILVNSAGIQRRCKAEDFPIEDWDEVIEVNLSATFDLCQRAARVMLPRGYGKIINIASLLSFFGGITVPAYAASKGGVVQLTKAFANEWASKGINVNAIAPGYMDTDMNIALINDKERYPKITERIPSRRWGTADDIAGTAIYLASKGSDYVDGTVIPVDGGYLGR